MAKVLVVATSRKTRGGITAVVKAHEKGDQWKEYHCKWIETHIDRNVVCKLWYFIKGWLTFLILLPSYDIVHFHMSEPPSAIRKSFFFPFAMLLGKKTIVHFHSFSPATTINGKYKRVYRYLFSHADIVIVLSKSWKKVVNDTFNLGDKVRVIYNPCTAELNPREYAKKNQILYAGTINMRKGYQDMIESFADIANDFPEWQIVFAGNGDIEQGKILAEHLGISNQTVFVGWVSGEFKDKVFKESRIFCLPSYAEGFPMAVLDAWAYGLPVITTPVGGIPDVADDGRNMLLFPPGDKKELTHQMRRLITDTNLRQTIASNSKKLAMTKFNIETINSEIKSVYKELSTTKTKRFIG